MSAITYQKNNERPKNAIVAMLLISPFIVFGIVFPEDFFGWVLLLMSYTILLSCEKVRTRLNYFWPSMIGMTLHNVMSFANAYIGTTIGADADAKVFHTNAVIYASVSDKFELHVGSELYTQLMASLYRIFGPSLFTAEMTSAIAFSLTIVIFIKVMDMIGVKRHQGKILFMFTALPTMMFMTSVTLREPWQVLFYMLVIYFGLKLRIKQTLMGFAGLVVSALLLGLLHNGLMAYAPLVVMLSFFWIYSKKEGQRSRVGNRMTAILVSVIAVFVWLIVNNSGLSSTASEALTSGSIADYANQYRSGSQFDARASYGVTNDGTLFGLIKSFPLMFFYYMFAPLPWQMQSAMDVYAGIESFLRFFLLIFAIKAWRSSQGEEKRRTSYLLLAFLSVEALWSIGTINWGTAIRHHLIGYGVLLAIGGPMMFDRLKRFVSLK